MRKNLSTLVVLLCLAATWPFVGNARKINRSHKIKHHKISYETVDKPAYRDVLNTDTLSAATLLGFAKTLIGIPYRPATSDPSVGFDCSGFVSYVFKNFDFNVPRSSCEFINVGEKVRFEDAKPGDIILFTGTKNHDRRIGHIGIVLDNGADGFKFIHSTSGKAYGVTITTMDDNYQRRFVQIIRLLKQNNEVLASR